MPCFSFYSFLLFRRDNSSSSVLAHSVFVSVSVSAFSSPETHRRRLSPPLSLSIYTSRSYMSVWLSCAQRPWPLRAFYVTHPLFLPALLPAAASTTIYRLLPLTTSRFAVVLRPVSPPPIHRLSIYVKKNQPTTQAHTPKKAQNEWQGAIVTHTYRVRIKEPDRWPEQRLPADQRH